MRPECPRCGNHMRIREHRSRDGRLMYQECGERHCRATFNLHDREKRAPDTAIRYLAWRWRHRYCASRDRKHRWLFYGPDATTEDRRCLLCGIRD